MILNTFFSRSYKFKASVLQSVYCYGCSRTVRIAFEKQYPNLISKLLFEARCAKEGVYFHPDTRYKKTINFEDIVDDEEFEDAKMKFVFQPGALNQMLDEKGYINDIRNAMLDFKNNHISGNPIHVAFMTGGASRMDFLKPLIKECYSTIWPFS